MVVIWLIPEILMVVTVLSVFVILKFLVKGHLEQLDNEAGARISTNLPVMRYSEAEQQPISQETLLYLLAFAKLLSTTALLIASVLVPSATSGVYFILFLGCATWWGCHRELEK